MTASESVRGFSPAVGPQSPPHMRAPRRALIALLCLGWPAALPAGELRVRVADAAGGAAPNLVVTVEPTAGTAPRPAPRQLVMDQVDRAFDPELLVVPVGSTVSFPNSDLVSHQVYSFSPARRFQLPLYRGTAYPPVRFEQPGLVTLGCNIHDNMIGYIVVTDAPWFGVTDAAGVWQAELPAGEYRVHVRHPRMRRLEDELGGTVQVDPRQPTQLALRLASPLRPAPLKGPAKRWDY